MYCKNCGNEMVDLAVICVKCGVAKGSGNSFCAYCGKELPQNADICMSCGVPVNSVPAGYSQRSKLAAGLLGIFLGSLGVHNFYLGYTGKAVAQLLIFIFGSCFFGIGPIATSIWGLIEGIMILTDGIKTDAKGVQLKD